MKPVFRLVAVLLAAGAFSVYAFPLRTNGLLSAARFFSLGGKRYSVGETAGGDSLLREELRKRGLDVRRIPRELLDSDDLVLDTLSEMPPGMPPRPLPLPSGLRVENAMGIESGAGFLDITSGKIPPKGTCARKDLAAKGWTVVGTEDPSTPVCIGTIRNGRETAIVVLEEKEGDFLYIREWEK